ncbi:MAG: AAA family ATPase [Lachnospiraceae bacterium]|nr:AAA family ATPase [Lachnospiraceae bacterium]
MKKPLELAVYGKGGIGKSTVSANLSAALALSGKRVLQIGCDPKHDSTRLLMGGTVIPTVLDYLKTVDKQTARTEEILRTGFMGVGCIEAGGPKPGVGCAGRGIITAFEFLNQHHTKDAYDIVLYDVLGDVVCGGFAVPVRREYADAIFLVTSGEFMALYAANNILRGIRNYDGDTWRRVAGIIFNERKVTDETERVNRFARAVGLPICARVPRSDALAHAERQNRTLMQMEDCEAEQNVFHELARQIGAGLRLYEACPLSDEELERVVFDAKEQTLQRSAAASCPIAPAEDSAYPETESEEPPVATGQERPPLYGCAFNGAATAAINLKDALVIAHSPKACAFYTWQNISSPGRKNLFNRGILMPSAISPHFECTEMEQSDVVFGGIERLREAVTKAISRHPGAVVVISSCVSGITGDDIRSLEALSTPEVPVITIPADGDIAGDYMEGIRLATHTLAQKLIDPSIRPQGRLVNLVGETGVSNNREVDFRIVKSWLDAMDISIGCRYLGESTCAQMRNFLAAPLNILANDNAEGRELKSWLSETYGCTFLDEALPVGFEATARWLRKLGSIFDCTEEAEKLIAGQHELYLEEIERWKPVFQGKRVFMTTINTNMDWLLDAADAVGLRFVFIGVMNYLRQPVKITDHPEKYPIDENFDWSRSRTLIKELHPDIVLSNYVTRTDAEDCLIDSMPMSPVVGFHSGIETIARWGRLMQTKRKGEWTNDRSLFEKYYA